MLCPQCHRPYFFIHPQESATAQCLRCKFTDIFRQPSYDSYHDIHYSSKPYTRTEQTDPQMKTILAKLRILSSQKVLDIGCGVGDYTKAIHRYTQNVIGLDQSVLSAQRKYPDLSFLAYDCNQTLPFRDQSVDAVVSVNLIEHLVNYDNLLQECQRVIKPGGLIALTTANLNFVLHDYFYDVTHVHEWSLHQFNTLVSRFLSPYLSKRAAACLITILTTDFL